MHFTTGVTVSQDQKELEAVLPCTQAPSHHAGTHEERREDVKGCGECRKQEEEESEKRCISTTAYYSGFLVFLTQKEQV